MILIVLMIIPLTAAILSALIDRSRFGAVITLTGAIGILVLSVYSIMGMISSPGHVLVSIPGWIALDAFGGLILFLVAFVNMTASLFSVGYMDFSKGGSRRYYLNFNLFTFSMLVVPLLQEPNIVWIAVELTTLFSVLLVGFENTHEALEAAWKYVVLTLMGAAIALLGFLILYWAARHARIESYTWSGLLLAAPHMSPTLLEAAFVFILVGFGAKVGLVPLHTWLPDAHSQAPSPVCALLSGVETTVVLYVILRLLPVVKLVPSLHADMWLVSFGLVSVGAAAFLLLQVRDYKRLFAFSTVEHMGIILTAAGIGGGLAHTGVMLQIMGHALTKSFCFYAAGSVLLLMGTRDIASVRGLIKRAPATGVALLLGGLAIAGAPPFVLFMSEFSILRAGLHRGEYFTVGLLVLFIAIAFFAIMNHVSRMVFGSDETSENGFSMPLPMSCKFTLAVAAVPVAVLGLYIPGALYKLLILAASTMGG